ncbi:hypothetical protein AZE42_04772 [Rhizopogon vesiculosus]|uniref:Uncharacterized protein n=1 Tax=Rhizopogon vesiculosus TaxID=180088 RepID=A0A1J8Q6Z5_9AGAM|nr:hypothetical protein AZE42_04772 [Rhizopogon vesiculosus]
MTYPGTAESEGETRQWDLGAHARFIYDMMKSVENEAVEEKHEEEEEKELQHELCGHDRGRPPMLRKKKSSYDLRDIFHHQEAEASKSKVSSPVASNPCSPDESKVSSPSIEAPAQQHAGKDETQDGH